MITLRTLGIAASLAPAATAPSFPVQAATTAVSGTFVVDTGSVCTSPPDGFEELAFVISGDLEGCRSTDIGGARDLGPPSGLYLEVGQFASRWDPDFTTGGTEIWGRCQHSIVRGSGTGGQHGVARHLVRTDTATDGSAGSYRGVVRQT